MAKICDVWMSDVGHANGIKASGMPMDRNEYLRRALALELRAADFVCSGLRVALLNVAARYRSLANQAVARRADGKRERLQAVARQNAASEKASGATVQEPARIGIGASAPACPDRRPCSSSAGGCPINQTHEYRASEAQP
jgi:hypothetical protein